MSGCQDPDSPEAFIEELKKSDPLAAEMIQEKNLNRKLQLTEQIMAKGEYDRWVQLDNAAELAYKTGSIEKAKGYALESLQVSSGYIDDWNYGNAIHNSSLVLGQIALDEGDIGTSVSHLESASATPGSPQLNSFGPDLILAQRLFAQGEEEAVMQYLEAIGAFWEMDYGAIEKWKNQIENNQTPSFNKSEMF